MKFDPEEFRKVLEKNEQWKRLVRKVRSIMERKLKEKEYYYE